MTQEPYTVGLLAQDGRTATFQSPRQAMEWMLEYGCKFAFVVDEETDDHMEITDMGDYLLVAHVNHHELFVDRVYRETVTD